MLFCFPLQPPMAIDRVETIDSWSNDVSVLLDRSFNGKDIIAMDSEGVDLGRSGTISIVQIMTGPKEYFIIDVLGKKMDDPLVGWLRKILEDPSIKKVVHDCRMDSDAMLHHLGIELSNVHDTSVHHQVISGNAHVGLNPVLRHNGIEENDERDKSVYTNNHEFWDTRPITVQMTAWALKDLSGLLALSSLQSIAIGNDPLKVEEVKSLTDEFLTWARSSSVGIINVKNVGRFIGRNGSNIRMIQKDLKVLCYGIGPRPSNRFVVYYDSIESFHRCKRMQ